MNIHFAIAAGLLLCWAIFFYSCIFRANSLRKRTPLIIITRTLQVLVWIFLFTPLTGLEFFDMEIPPLVRFSGLFLLANGIIMSLFGICQLMRKARKHELYTRGIFAITRNPVYVGFILMMVGSIVFLPHPISLIMALIAIVLNHIVIMKEENKLKVMFPEQWQEYRKKVKRYI